MISGSVSALFLAEIVLAYATKGADKIFRKIFPLGSGSDSAILVALCLIIFPHASFTNIYIHLMHLTFRLSDVDQLLWIISESEIFAIHFVIRLGIAADRAALRRTFSVIQIATVGAEPNDFLFFAENLIVLYVRQQ